MTAVIETQGLTKFYGESLGITDLDLVVEHGEVFGFLGPNGAGKSTTIRTLLNFLHPTRGSGTVLGLDISSGSLEIKRRTGYLPGDLALYDQMTARELLTYFANLRKQATTSMVKGLQTGSTSTSIARSRTTRRGTAKRSALSTPSCMSPSFSFSTSQQRG